MKVSGKQSGQTAGFTLLEVLASTVLIALIAVFFYAPNAVSKIQDFRRLQADVVAEELNRVGLAAQDWALDNNGNWPSMASDCAFLFTTLVAGGKLDPFDGSSQPASAFYHVGEKNIPTENPLFTTIELGRYYPYCDNDQLQVEVFFSENDARWGHYIANRLAGAAASDLGKDSENVVKLQSFWPLPTAIPLLDGYVSKAEPEFTGAMVSNVDLGGHAIIGANDVVLSNGHSLGKTVVYGTVIAPGRAIEKPTCAPGLTPQIFASFNNLFHSRGRPIHYAEVFTEEREINPAWVVRSRVIASAGGSGEYDNPNLKITVLIRCS